MFCGGLLLRDSRSASSTTWYSLASIDCFRRLAMRWRSSSRIRSSVGIARVSERIGAGSRDVVVADQLYRRRYPLGAAPTRHDHRAMTNELAPARHPHNPHCEGPRPCLPHLGWRVVAENG